MLRELRGRFLRFDRRNAGELPPDRSDYWGAARGTPHYNFTFGERIGWKWDTVLAELKARGWIAAGGAGAGLGLRHGRGGEAGGRAWPGAIRELRLWDRSGLAREFAEGRAR